MTTKQKAENVIKELEALYPEVECGLIWSGDPWHLLIMAILSARCKDSTVNDVAPKLFDTFKTPYDMAIADIKDIETAIRGIGLYHSKAQALKECCMRLCEAYGGEVPSEMDDLLTLRGVGRKVANLIRGDLYDLGGIVADTHCIRISGRLGFANGKDPLDTEKKLEKIIPKEKQSDYCHRMVLFGREYCPSQNPKCEKCPLKKYCVYEKNGK